MIFVANMSTAQVRTKFQPNYDNKKVHFGYFLGLANTKYNVKFNNSYLANVNNGKVYAISSPTSTGIKAGGLVNVYINDYLDFRLSPLSERGWFPLGEGRQRR
jgi:hypothetical protein